MILLNHPTGNEFVRNVLKALSDSGMLSGFRTCISWDDDPPVNNFLTKKMRAELSRRSFQRSVRPLIGTRPWLETGRLLSAYFGIAALVRHETGLFSVDAVYRDLDRAVAGELDKIPGLKGVYAYEDGAFDTFNRAHDMGLKCIYDLPIGYWRAARKIFREEAELEPEWAPTLTGNLDSEEKLLRKEKEIALADTVIVPSTFVRQSLDMAEISKDKIKVIPFGAPEPAAFPLLCDGMKKLKVLYAGSLTQRKGLSYLLKAVSMASDMVELTLIGRKPCEGCRPLDEAVKKYRWIPSLPHGAMLEEMRRHDVLVLPSLFEGFALVILEAMSQGLTVIVTPNTAGADIIEEGKDGYIVPIRSADSIAEKLAILASNGGLLESMKQAAISKASACSWASYRERIIEAVRETVG